MFDFLPSMNVESNETQSFIGSPALLLISSEPIAYVVLLFDLLSIYVFSHSYSRKTYMRRIFFILVFFKSFITIFPTAPRAILTFAAASVIIAIFFDTISNTEIKLVGL